MLNAILMMLVLGALLGLGLGLASKFLHVQPDERVDTVAGMLPGYNCGGCGYPGCSGFASALHPQWWRATRMNSSAVHARLTKRRKSSIT